MARWYISCLDTLNSSANSWNTGLKNTHHAVYFSNFTCNLFYWSRSFCAIPFSLFKVQDYAKFTLLLNVFVPRQI